MTVKTSGAASLVRDSDRGFSPSELSGTGSGMPKTESRFDSAWRLRLNRSTERSESM